MTYHILLPRGKRGSCPALCAALGTLYTTLLLTLTPSGLRRARGGRFWGPPCLITDPSPPGRGEVPGGGSAGLPSGLPSGQRRHSGDRAAAPQPDRGRPSRAVPGPSRAEPSRACGAGGAASSPPPRLCGGAGTRAGGGEAEVRQGRRRVGAGLGGELPSAEAAGSRDGAPPPPHFPCF